jgi:hypothetical protein
MGPRRSLIYPQLSTSDYISNIDKYTKESIFAAGFLSDRARVRLRSPKTGPARGVESAQGFAWDGYEKASPLPSGLL